MKIEFETTNAVFIDEFEEEVSRILKKIIKQINSGETEGVIFDLNGNKVGKWSC